MIISLYQLISSRLLSEDIWHSRISDWYEYYICQWTTPIKPDERDILQHDRYALSGVSRRSTRCTSRTLGPVGLPLSPCCDYIIAQYLVHVKRFFKSFFQFVRIYRNEVDILYDSVKTAQNIKDMCLAKGISMKRLGEMCENDRNIVNKIANGSLCNISVFCAIAHALNTPLDSFIDNTKPYQLK